MVYFLERVLTVGARHIPMRMCTGCSRMKGKHELIRIVKVKEKDGNDCGGLVLIDRSAKRPGRGAYLCRDVECLLKVRKNRRLERIFSCKLDDEFYERVRKEMTDDEQ